MILLTLIFCYLGFHGFTASGQSQLIMPYLQFSINIVPIFYLRIYLYIFNISKLHFLKYVLSNNINYLGSSFPFFILCIFSFSLSWAYFSLAWKINIPGWFGKPLCRVIKNVNQHNIQAFRFNTKLRP